MADILEHKLKIERDGLRATISNIPKGFRMPYLMPYPQGAARYDAINYYSSPRKEPVSIVADTPDLLEAGIAVFERTLKEMQSRQGRRERIRDRLLADKLLGSLEEKEVSINYDGYGDSGDIQDRSFEDKDAPEGDHYADFLWSMMWSLHSGFENNEGGQGNVTWDLVDDVITIEHSDNVMTTSDTTTVL